MTTKDKHILYFAFLLIGFSLNAQIKSIYSITINDSTIKFNDSKTITLPISPDSLIKHLGKARLERGHPNSIYYWDTLAVMGYMPNDLKSITSLDICFSESGYYETKSFYKGKVIINGQSIDKDMTKSRFAEVFMRKEGFLPELEIGTMKVLVEFEEKGNILIGVEVSKNK